MNVTYLTTPIVEVRHDPPPRGSGMTREGYTKKSGAPTSRMIRLQGEKRWRRLMVWQFSNLGTMFVNIDGKPHVVREEMIPQEGAVTSHATMSRTRATKKRSPAQLDREIAEVIGARPINKRKRVRHFSEWNDKAGRTHYAVTYEDRSGHAISGEELARYRQRETRR